eukprot:scaffold3665_cov102-Isochrysis_galbana.AAC.5
MCRECRCRCRCVQEYRCSPSPRAPSPPSTPLYKSPHVSHSSRHKRPASDRVSSRWQSPCAAGPSQSVAWPAAPRPKTCMREHRSDPMSRVVPSPDGHLPPPPDAPAVECEPTRPADSSKAAR